MMKEALVNNSFCLLENFASSDELPSWSEIIQSANDSAQTTPKFHVQAPLTERQINSTICLGVGYFYSIVSEEDEHIRQKVKPLTDELGKNGLPLSVAHAFISLFTGDESAALHNDPGSNNLYIQCEGTTKWELYASEDPSQVIYKKYLNPGEAIFFTGDVHHAVTPATPRAAILLRMPSM